MKLRLLPILISVSLISVIMSSVSAPVFAAETRIIRFGYLDHPGSALCRIAAAQGHFSEEGLQVELIGFADSDKGLAALEKGAIDVGAFNIAASLRAIAGGKGFRIIVGGGTPMQENPLAELDNSLQAENEGQGIVVMIPPAWPSAGKETITRLTVALIRAYRTHRQQPRAASPAPGKRLDWAVHYDPNPDYWRLERIWCSLGLQDSAVKRDFLANHVYEEIYCDALDRLLDGSPDDQVFKDLSSKAVCTPDCCPKKAANKHDPNPRRLKGGSSVMPESIAAD
jgi:hypothetical protein